MYAQANALGVRRIASQTYEAGDVNLVRLLDMLIRDPARNIGASPRRAWSKKRSDGPSHPPDMQGHETGLTHPSKNLPNPNR